MLSLYKHDNIVSLLGFCDENDEKILVYEYASRRSLDSYLNKDDLIWIQRLNICIGAARGLAYLHNPFGTQQRVLHRDIKSSNILLDENWNAKISDLGLLTKESDVYSFGVVLFEVLCGRLCIGNKNGIHRPSLTGGCDKNGNILKSAELYDSSTGRWEILPDMHSSRRLCSCFFMDKKFYVIGGMTSSTDSLTCGEEFDLNTKQWRKIDGMYPIIVNKITQAPPLVAAVSDELYALDYMSSMVKKYDKNKNSWDVLGRLPVKASSMEGWSLVFKACGDRLLVVYVQKSRENASIVLNSWSPKSRIEDGILDWNVLGVKEQQSQFVYDCAVMGC
ncbi:unnamed protein product [Lactuca saligna]|uniref:Protein kinase domain-containing protein n=1 Tax=Lactuca saligna TaxID=75948 RepID=A0AA35ZJ09_LACSI|nr:unnamed protein product [Lactuca saligna]